jgi:hypothetical protein
VGGHQYGKSEEVKTFQIENNTSAARPQRNSPGLFLANHRQTAFEANVTGRFWHCSFDPACGRAELLGLGTEGFQVREEHWVDRGTDRQGKAHPYSSCSSVDKPRQVASAVVRSSGEQVRWVN